MATYVNDLRLKEIATGDESGTWGTSTNTNLELIANAMGVGAEAIANASTHTITMADGTADEFRSTFLRLTGGGQACTVTLAPNTLSHTWIMRNETAAVLTLTQGSGANVTIAAGQTKIVATDGAGSGAVVYEMDDLELAGNLAVGGTLAVTGAFTNGSTLVSTGKITADAGIDIDNINIDGTTIALSSGDLTLDVAGDIVLDADGQDIRLKDAGTEWGRFTHTGHFGIQNPVSDADILFFGNDGGSTITALTLDMSAAGAATFNAGATFAGNVGIAASPTQARLDILQESDYSSHTGHGLSILSNASNAYTALYIGSDDTVDAAYIQTAARNTSFTSKSLLLNPNGGKVGIGEASPAATLHLDSTGVTAIAFDSNASTQQYEMGTGYAGVGSANNFYLYNNTTSSAALIVDAAGALLVGTTSSDYVHDKGLKVVSGAVGANILDSAVSITGSGGDFYSLNMMGGTKGFGILTVFSSSVPYVQWRYRTGTSDTDIIRFDSDGDVVITGSISKGSGSFKIDHPLPAKAATHHLVHSFIEGPQADNIYRGKIDLVDGTATVNIDTEAGMTEGTYVVLNTNTQCFTSNESGWTAVKGSVSGNTLTITAQESCTDTISWMVIGERKDPHMVNAKWTDDDGKVIVEPLKENN
jgi:hypothetical protein